MKLASFSAVIAKLEKHYGRPPAPQTTDALGLIIHENIAYLVTDEKRATAFAALRKNVGLKPTAILSASIEDLVAITKLGGVQPERRAARLKEIAQIALNDFAGDLKNALKLPLARARKALQKFPAIGAPGAERILLFTKSYPVLGLDSNGLRVLLRIGFGEEHKYYSGSYASVQDAIKDEIGSDCDFLIGAHQLLRQHGKQLCRTSHPACEICPLRSDCSYYRLNKGSG